MSGSQPAGAAMPGIAVRTADGTRRAVLTVDPATDTLALSADRARPASDSDARLVEVLGRLAYSAEVANKLRSTTRLAFAGTDVEGLDDATRDGLLRYIREQTQLVRKALEGVRAQCLRELEADRDDTSRAAS